MILSNACSRPPLAPCIYPCTFTNRPLAAGLLHDELKHLVYQHQNAGDRASYCQKENESITVLSTQVGQTRPVNAYHTFHSIKRSGWTEQVWAASCHRTSHSLRTTFHMFPVVSEKLWGRCEYTVSQPLCHPKRCTSMGRLTYASD